jgi:hypothetical protein
MLYQTSQDVSHCAVKACEHARIRILAPPPAPLSFQLSHQLQAKLIKQQPRVGRIHFQMSLKNGHIALTAVAKVLVRDVLALTLVVGALELSSLSDALTGIFTKAWVPIFHAIIAHN